MKMWSVCVYNHVCFKWALAYIQPIASAKVRKIFTCTMSCSCGTFRNCDGAADGGGGGDGDESGMVCISMYTFIRVSERVNAQRSHTNIIIF